MEKNTICPHCDREITERSYRLKEFRNTKEFRRYNYLVPLLGLALIASLPFSLYVSRSDYEDANLWLGLSIIVAIALIVIPCGYHEIKKFEKFERSFWSKSEIE